MSSGDCRAGHDLVDICLVALQQRADDLASRGVDCGESFAGLEVMDLVVDEDAGELHLGVDDERIIKQKLSVDNQTKVVTNYVHNLKN